MAGHWRFSYLSVGEPGHTPMPDYRTERVRLKHGLRRSTSTGQFHLDNRWDLVGNPDPYPPARVIDFQIDGVDRKERRVTLSWTAPGSNLDTGTGRLKAGMGRTSFWNKQWKLLFINQFYLYYIRLLSVQLSRLKGRVAWSCVGFYKCIIGANFIDFAIFKTVVAIRF